MTSPQDETEDYADVGPPPTKRSKPSGGADRDARRRAWEHYRNFIDSPEDDGGDGDEGEGEGEEGVDGQEGGDVDELLELIEILSPFAVSPLTFEPPVADDDDDAESHHVSFHCSVESLLPVLLSMSHLHLASHAVSEIMFDPNQKGGGNGDDALTSPEHYFRQSLHYWSTNPAASSLLANYHRMNSLSSTEDICELYTKAADYAGRWRREALRFLQQDDAPGGSEGDDAEDALNAKEWVELLVLNGALDVDYIGEDDEEENDDEEEIGDADDSTKQRDGEGEGEEYSPSDVEATASFMSAFLLSILSRHKDALPHLQKFGLTHRIHPNVWKAAQSRNHNDVDDIGARPGDGDKPSSLLFSPRMYRGRGSDGVLPPELYRRLCTLFAPDASYWQESDYNNRGYYSYFIDLDGKAKTDDLSPSVRERPTNVIEDVIVNHLLPLAEQTLRDSTTGSKPPERIVGAEWWVHTRPLGANLGHQVHFDTDESLLGREKRVTHPIISSVLYLTGAPRDCKATAGSTVVFDQSPESTEVASRAYVSHPKDNSFMTFPGNLLHGVLPCIGNDAGTDGGSGGKKNRLTFMVGWWTRIVPDGMGERELYTPCGPLPPSDSEHSWVVQSQEGYGGTGQRSNEDKDGRQEKREDAAFDALPSVSPAWEKIEVARPQTTASSGLNVPRGLDHRFFVRDAPRCFSESLYEKEDCF